LPFFVKCIFLLHQLHLLDHIVSYELPFYCFSQVRNLMELYVEVSMRFVKSALVLILFIAGSLIACSPTKFSSSNSNDSQCDSKAVSCVRDNDVLIKTYNKVFRVGQGKTDILFINDNSASMSVIQSRMAYAFSGFITNLYSKNIDFRIAMTTTDATKFTNLPLLSIGANGASYIDSTLGQTNVNSFFSNALVRKETLDCESFIKSAYYTYGPGFRSSTYYVNNYSTYCPSSDERGILGAYTAINKASDFVRSDANLNIILISNEDVRSGLYSTNPSFALTSGDKTEDLISLITSKYPQKFWQFNSIVTKDISCANEQKSQFKDKNGNTILDSNGSPVVDANIGYEYLKLSNSSAKDVDGNVSTRGITLSICESNYANYFSNIAAMIADSARLMSLECAPYEAPTVTSTTTTNVPYQWTPGSSSIIFKKGSEGIDIQVTYKCKTALVQ